MSDSAPSGNALEARSLQRSFGGIVAVNDVNLAVPRGQLRCIIGPNGAGKTTLFNLLTGRVRTQRGEILFEGKDITRLAPHRRCRIGIGRTFQINNVFPDASVIDNVRLALLAYHRRTWNMFTPAKTLLNDEIDGVLDMVGLAQQRDRQASQISYGDRRRLELAIALACRPSLLLLDEPTCGMPLSDRPPLMALIQEIRKKTGMTVVLIEHDMDIVFSVAERISVMHRGKLIADDTPAAIAANPQVQEVYLGEDHGRA
ncbi:MAG: ABC transporter ATP-binding protein [Alphaproteobacteria bacterium]